MADRGNLRNIAQTVNKKIFLHDLARAPEKGRIHISAAAAACEIIPVECGSKVEADFVIAAGKPAARGSNRIVDNTESPFFNHLEWTWLPKHLPSPGTLQTSEISIARMTQLIK